MYKVILIDDEPLASRMVKEYLEPYKDLSVQAICHDGFEGLKAIQQFQPDLIFLDIQMPKINGFEMLELLENPPAVIFTTAFDEYAIRAFEHHALDYLLKPFSQERFDKAVQKFLSRHPQTAAEQTKALLETAAAHPQQFDRVVIRENSNIRIIPIADIHYIEAADDYAKIVTGNGSFLKNRTMAAFEKQLPPETFVRIHRSYIVHVAQITQLHPHEKETYTAILRNGRQLPVSKTGYMRLREVLGINR
ncbi:LytR/AlgR family response regulator transcription factor [Flavihumibacter petaseus]|uniref:Putative two-component response regulator n=1 Tax=Flavihumibacter petaseus NBRC 106054 TaxID=1220578 RepID=A0A0E9MWW8_9BACT|nr:LytTR family DNA-binding domain-containing protein [Flavihumibacter petaseus]GAO41615.1 putative two-component response regulator [Flavihumibacter petaseus NBRC 106054]